MAKEKKITSIEIELIGGPLHGEKRDFAYPVRDYYLLNMGQDLYVKKTSTEFYHSTDKSIIKIEESII
jgi:hypothetical protein